VASGWPPPGDAVATADCVGHGVATRPSSSPRTQTLEQLGLVATAPREDQEQVIVALAEDVVGGGDVLARVLAVRAAAARLELAMGRWDERQLARGEHILDVVRHLAHYSYGGTSVK
jgi:hypothetical protein